MSPDGRQLYTGPNVIGIFFRDPSTGALSQPAGAASCIGTVAGGCTPRPRPRRRSPDGALAGRPLALRARRAAATPSPSSTATRPPARCARRTVPRAASARPRPARRSPRPGRPSAGRDRQPGQPARLRVGRRRHARLRAGGRRQPRACRAASATGGATGCSRRPQPQVSVSYSAISPDGQTIVAGNEYDVPGIAIFDRDGDGNLVQPAGRRRMRDAHRRGDHRRRRRRRAVPRPPGARRQRPDDVRRRRQLHRGRAHRQRRHGVQARPLPAVPEPGVHGHAERRRAAAVRCARTATATR